MKSNKDEISVETLSGDSFKTPFNGTGFSMIPHSIISDHHFRKITTAEYEVLRYIISKYGWKNIIPPKLSNDDLSFIFNVKTSYIKVLVSRLKTRGYITTRGYGKERQLCIPEYEKILITFNSK